MCQPNPICICGLPASALSFCESFSASSKSDFSSLNSAFRYVSISSALDTIPPAPVSTLRLFHVQAFTGVVSRYPVASHLLLDSPLMKVCFMPRGVSTTSLTSSQYGLFPTCVVKNPSKPMPRLEYSYVEPG